jgi:hypothetical protein
MHSHIED